MKFRTEKWSLTDHFGMTTNDGNDLWMSLPMGSSEGFLYGVQQWRGVWPDDHPDEKLRGQQKDPGGRHTNIALLDRVLEWNADDEDGKPLPLTRTITELSPEVKALAKKESIPVDEALFRAKIEIMTRFPVEMYLEMAERMMNTKPLTPQAEDFSKTSSEA